MFNAYAEAVIHLAGLVGNSFTASQLNDAVMQMPTMETVYEYEGLEASDLPLIEGDGSLTRIVQSRFFDMLKNKPPRFEGMAALIERSRLASMNGWAEWQMFVKHLEPMGLMPCIVFRNDPLVYGDKLVYVSDVRVGFGVGYMR